MPVRVTATELAATPGYAHVARIEEGESLVVTAGAVPLDPEGNLVGEGDAREQARQTLANLAAALRAVGSDLTMVVKSTVYVVGRTSNDLAEVWEEVRASELSHGPHASTLLGVTVLGYPGQLVEVEAIAVAHDPATG